MIRKDDFIQDIQQTIYNSLGKTIKSLANNFQVSDETIRNVVHENIKYKSTVLKKGQFLPEKMKKSVIQIKMLLNKIKHPAAKDVIWFFSDDQDQKVNRRNDR